MFFGNEAVANFLEELYRRIRKYKGSAEVITQSITDFDKNSKTIAIYENAAWKCTLEQTSDSVEKAVKGGRLSISRFTEEIMKSVKNRAPLFGEIFIKEEKSSLVGRLKTDPFSHYTYTNHPKDVELIGNVKSRFNYSEYEAVLFLSKKVDNPSLSEDELCNMVEKITGKAKEIFEAQEARHDSPEYWRDLFANAFSNDKFKLYIQPIKNCANEKIDGYECLVRLTDENNEIIPTGLMLKWAKHKDVDYYKAISRLVIQKALMHFNDIEKVFFSVNIDIDDIKDDSFVSYVKDILKNHSSVANRMIFEIKDSNVESSIEEMESFIKTIHSVNAKCAIDNIGINFKHMRYILSLNIEYIKLDESIMHNITSRKDVRTFAGFMIEFTKSRNIKTVGVHVGDKQIYENIKFLGVDYAQGFYIEKPNDFNYFFGNQGQNMLINLD